MTTRQNTKKSENIPNEPSAASKRLYVHLDSISITMHIISHLWCDLFIIFSIFSGSCFQILMSNIRGFEFPLQEMGDPSLYLQKLGISHAISTVVWIDLIHFLYYFLLIAGLFSSLRKRWPGLLLSVWRVFPLKILFFFLNWGFFLDFSSYFSRGSFAAPSHPLRDAFWHDIRIDNNLDTQRPDC